MSDSYRSEGKLNSKKLQHYSQFVIWDLL